MRLRRVTMSQAQGWYDSQEPPEYYEGPWDAEEETEDEEEAE